MIKALIKEFPVTTVTQLTPTEKKIKSIAYTKEEVNLLIEAAVEEAVKQAREIDEESMAKHNRDATVISMILGFTTLALFVDGLLRMLGIIPPFMHIDINILDKVVEAVKDDLGEKILTPIQRYGLRH